MSFSAQLRRGARYHRTSNTGPASHRAPRTMFLTKRVIVASTALALLGGASLAYGYWAGSGTGSGAAGSTSAGSASTLTVTAGAPIGAVEPGTSVAMTMSVANSNAFTVQISSIALDTTQGTSGYTIDSAHVTAGCTVAAASLTFTTATTGWTIPNGTSTVTTPASLSMGASAASACQGASITVFVKAS